MSVATTTAAATLAPQPSLWDVLARRASAPCPARVSRRARRVTERATEPPSPTPSTAIGQPLRLGPPWPQSDVALAVEGETASAGSAGRRFSFRRALWCGAQCYVLLAPWESRDDRMAALVSVSIERVRVVSPSVSQQAGEDAG